MIPLATFEVIGVPAPQGSKTRMPNGAMLEAGSKTGRLNHRAWRDSVTWAARRVRLGPPITGPVAVQIRFRMPLPSARPAAVRRAGQGWHAVKPDLDKLVRTVLDALTAGGVIADDARVCWLKADAVEVAGWTGAVITIGTPPPLDGAA